MPENSLASNAADAGLLLLLESFMHLVTQPSIEEVMESSVNASEVSCEIMLLGLRIRKL